MKHDWARAMRDLRQKKSIPTDKDTERMDAMGNMVEEILADSDVLAPEDFPAIERVKILCQRRLAFQDKNTEMAEKLLGKLTDSERILLKLGFGEEDITALNFWVLEQEKEGLLFKLLRQVEEKLAEAQNKS